MKITMVNSGLKREKVKYKTRKDTNDFACGKQQVNSLVFADLQGSSHWPHRAHDFVATFVCPVG